MKNPEILVINTGSTSTKIAYYQGDNQVFTSNITHDNETLSRFTDVLQQIDYRKKVIVDLLAEHQIDLSNIDIIMCRGGLIKPVSSGVYEVNDKMIDDLIHSPKKHASNLAAILGKKLAVNNQKVYIADPVVVDELQDVARFSGHKLFQRISIFHALNHKAVARKYAESIDKDYGELNLIVVHMGGGISVGAHQKGKVIDVNQALDGEGPFSPERSGTLPAGDLIKMAFSKKFTYDEMKQMLVGKGGLVSYTGTNDVRKLEKELTETNRIILQAMAYQVSKSIGEMAVVLQGKIDAIILTGGLAHSQFITGFIQKYVSFLAPVVLYPGEDEMEALAYNGRLVWSGKLKPNEY